MKGEITLINVEGCWCHDGEREEVVTMTAGGVSGDAGGGCRELNVL